MSVLSVTTAALSSSPSICAHGGVGTILLFVAWPSRRSGSLACMPALLLALLRTTSATTEQLLPARRTSEWLFVAVIAAWFVLVVPIATAFRHRWRRRSQSADQRESTAAWWVAVFFVAFAAFNWLWFRAVASGFATDRMFEFSYWQQGLAATAAMSASAMLAHLCLDGLWDRGDRGNDGPPRTG